MPDNTIITVEGTDQVCAMLAEAPKHAIPLALVRGFTAGGKVIEQYMVGRIPVRTGELLADLDVEVALDADSRGGYAAVGFSHGGSAERGLGQDYVARFLEYGHRMVGHKPDKKVLGKVEPYPFMRLAAEAAVEEAVEAFANAVMEALEREGLVDAA